MQVPTRVGEALVPLPTDADLPHHGVAFINSATQIIEHLGLEKLPREGGYFAETYRSPIVAPREILPDHREPRSLATAIYYLLTPGAFSAMHRLRGDEVFHFYLGDPADMLLLHADGSSETVTLGQDLRGGMTLQAIVPGGTWQGSRVRPGGASGYALLGTTMSPGFDFDDFELGDGPTLAEKYPARASAIRDLTHNDL